MNINKEQSNPEGILVGESDTLEGCPASGLLGNFLPQPEMGADGMPTAMPSFGSMALTGLYGIVMFVLAVIFIWWLTRPSDPETNAYGPPPGGASDG